MLSLVAITYGIYITWAMLPQHLGPDAKYALGVQGRYFTPLLVFLVPIANRLHKFASVRLSSDAVMGFIYLAITAVGLSCYVLETAIYFGNA
jgi:uncharacterized membrane protein